ncbi:SanA/YdcF family protein [Reichenbachiella ulvae]|uniref:YdcF family protein n=1 Tax=Reichenbachiella ulvae TaxID=2980104 RepID=A0ABT3CRH8_9BACT|nr:ElyC/SanA/YdcF family protein [Reichenbachiella ulvae]MCV9386109.1 YdcF family protein [Reichenbachiella ulvae]
MKIIKTLLACALLTTAFVLFCNFWIIGETKDRISMDTRELVGAEIGIVFGTSNKLIGGADNPFFYNRVNTAAQLIKSGKVEKLLLSGSRDSIYYNEAEMMKAALIDLGVSQNRLILDDNGDRTLESLARMRDVYGVESCVVVTQQYHAYRCLFLADHLGISAECLAAKTPEIVEHKKAILRELFARTKAVIDILMIYPEKSKN